MITATPAQLRKAADIQEKILSLQAELGQLLGASGPAETATTEASKRKGKMSARGLANIRAAQKAGWAAIKAAPSAKPAPEKKAKKKMSPQGLANIRAGIEKRMAAQGKTPSAKPAKSPKKKFSAAGRAALSAAAKARWAKAKKAGKTTL
jgi:hypothetical protein